jgi:hypothetical protein
MPDSFRVDCGSTGYGFDMSDLFFFRDSLEPEGAPDPLQSRRGGGAGEETVDELIDFEVQASDGSIGDVLDVRRAPGESYLLVSTGRTILSKKVMIPAGLVERVDRDAKTIHVNRSAEEIENGPEFDEESFRDESYRGQVSEYYAR